MHTTEHDTACARGRDPGGPKPTTSAPLGAARVARWTDAELETIAELAAAAQHDDPRTVDDPSTARLAAITEKARRRMAARRLGRPCADPSAADRFAQVAYVAPVEVLVDLRRGLVERVVVVDELLELDEAEAARAADSLAPLDGGLAQQAVAIAELDDTQPSASAGWPAWQIGR